MSRLSLVLTTVLLVSAFHESHVSALFDPIDIINPFNPLNPIKALEKALDLYKKYKEIKQQTGHSACTDKNQVDPGLSALTEHFQQLKLVIMKDILSDLCAKLNVNPKELLDTMDYLEDQHEAMIKARDEKHSISINHAEVKANVLKMHEIFAGKSDRTILKVIAEYSTVSDPMCVRAQSSQLVLFELFQLIVDSDQKGLQTIVYHLEKNSHQKKSEVTKAKENEIDNYKDRIDQTFDELKTTLLEATKRIARCDPKDFKKSSS